MAYLLQEEQGKACHTSYRKGGEKCPTSYNENRGKKCPTSYSENRVKYVPLPIVRAGQNMSHFLEEE